MDVIRAIDPDTIPVGGTVYAVFYPYDRFLQKCDSLTDAINDVYRAQHSDVPEDHGAVVVEITVKEVYRG
jgi:hypothetical protein